MFVEPGSIKALIGTVDDDTKLNAVKAPHAFSKDNYVGVEIECVIGSSEEYLKDKLIEASLQSYVQVKHDGSIGGYDREKNERGVELTVLAKQSEYSAIIRRVCDVLASKRIRGYANNTCGLHVHLDMRHRDVKTSYRNLYYGQSVMLGMVPESRRSGTHADRYCKRNKTADFNMHSNSDRYHVINTEAYRKYKTLEVRLHSGTVQAGKINNWIAMLVKMVDAIVPEQTTPTQSLDKFFKTCGITGSLADYIIKRTDKFADKKLSETDYVLSA